MGMVNEEFDRTFLGLMEDGDIDGTISYATDFVHTAGNGCEEIRMWMAAMGAAGGAPYRRTYYRAAHDWYTGIGTARLGQINMRKVDGWQTLATKPIDQPIDLAA